MKMAVLWLAALIVPLFWGYAVYWLMEWLWPARPSGAAASFEGSAGPLGGEHIHYEI